MDLISDDTVSQDDLRKYENEYNAQLKTGKVTKDCQFQYAFCLVRSEFQGDIKKGITLLEELFNDDRDGRREYLFYLALGHARSKEYTKALKYCKHFLEIEPNNQQVIALQKTIKEKLERAAKQGILAAGGGLLLVGAAVVGGILLGRK